MVEKEPIQIERTYEAPLDDVWELWTTKEGLESWWGPDEFFVKVRTLDLRVGGLLEYEMTTKNKDIMAYLDTAGIPATTKLRARFTEVVPKTRLAYVTRMDFVAGKPPEDIGTLVELIPAGKAVRVVLTLDPPSSPEMLANMKLGWQQELEKLATALAA